MLEVMVLAGLLVMLVMGTIASCGWDVQELRNREVWCWTIVLAFAGLVMPNPYAGLLTATVVVGLFQIGRSWYVLRSTIIPIVGFAAAYAVMTPYMQRWMIVYVL